MHLSIRQLFGVAEWVCVEDFITSFDSKTTLIYMEASSGIEKLD